MILQLLQPKMTWQKAIPMNSATAIVETQIQTDVFIPNGVR